jgi:retinoid hydroxylase
MVGSSGTGRGGLPPGSDGWPLLGETLPFIGDMFGFIAARTRRHGRVFRSHILGRPTVFISGAELTDAWLDPELIQRESSFPKTVQELFGGRSLPLLDGAVHRLRKELVMSAFRAPALQRYLPTLDRLVETSLAEWAARGTLELLPELKQLAVEGICATVFGIRRGALLDELVADYALVARGFTGLPIRLPGTAYGAALRARDRILARFGELLDAHQREAGDDGLALMLAARGPAGEQLDREALVLELHHVVLAGLIIYAEFAATVVALHEQPALLARLRAEVDEVAPKGALTPAAFGGSPLLLAVALETKRHCPNVPVSFGRAKRGFQLDGYTIPAGCYVFMAVGENNMNRAYFTAPERFDPDRFMEPRREHLRHPHAYQPQGAGPELAHKCAGADFSTLFMQLFTARLVRDHDFELPPQDLSLRSDLVPPEPKSGLLTQLRPR